MDALCRGWFSEIADESEATENPKSSWRGSAFSLQVDRVVFRERSQYQEIFIFERLVCASSRARADDARRLQQGVRRRSRARRHHTGDRARRGRVPRDARSFAAFCAPKARDGEQR